MKCEICGKEFIPVGNLLADTFQEYIADCECKMKKKTAFPNDQFRTQEDYFKFANENKVYGGDAYDLKKKLDKEMKIPYPKVNKINVSRLE